MKTSTRVTALMMLASMFPLSAMAGLTMVIDTSTTTFWFIGSDTGSLLSGDSGFTQGDWTSVTGTTSESGFDVGINSGLLVGTSGASTENLSIDFSSGLDSANTNGVYFKLTVSSYEKMENLTITGGGSSVKYDYSSFFVADVNSLIGTTININPSTLSGFSSINVVAASSIPEPSEWAGAAGLGVLALAFGRKRKAAK